MPSRIRLAITLLGAAVLTGCVTTAAHVHPHKPVPTEVVMDVSHEPMFTVGSKPIGATWVPDSQVYVLDSQKGMRVAGMFGIVGALAADVANQLSLDEGTQRAFKINLGNVLQESMIAAAQAQGQQIQVGTSAYVDRVKGRAMTVESAVMVIRVSETEYRPQVLLYARRLGETSRDGHYLGFSAPSPQARPLTGAGSWAEGDRLAIEARRLANELAFALVQELTTGLPRAPMMQATVALPLPDSIEARSSTVAYREGYRGNTLVYSYSSSYITVYLMPPQLLQPREARPWADPAASGSAPR